MLCNSFTREKRARIRACAILNKMLRMALNTCKIILSILKFCARIDARTYAHARVIWPEIYRTDIDLDHDKYEWEIPFGYEDMISWVDFRKILQNGA